MSEAVTSTIFRLLAVPAVTAIVGQDIRPNVVQHAAANIYVSLISDEPNRTLSGQPKTSIARVTVSLRVTDSVVMGRLGPAVVGALSGITALVKGRRCKFWKLGTDHTRWSDDGSVYERVIDFGVSYEIQARP